ncbi:hypothetical protein VFPFJ_07293 [Purpureocillium lilacinum]|uniref:Uncharacterized protein n=1 Tax=Purpureocillium lilacinum TaxID=33203 RepID=A0A179HGT4_PURLI|nr:hypothetical protein VFPFJ_07293 [Purpureocillium lilacinum]OAQ88828.1 hypothetical protein VFPFJ_07293 [Purpureocillium lilacinum]
MRRLLVARASRRRERTAGPARVGSWGGTIGRVGCWSGAGAGLGVDRNTYTHTCAWSGRAGLLWARCYFCGPTMLVPARAALGAAMLHGIVCATRGQDDDNNGNDDGWGQRRRRKRD